MSDPAPNSVVAEGTTDVVTAEDGNSDVGNDQHAVDNKSEDVGETDDGECEPDDYNSESEAYEGEPDSKHNYEAGGYGPEIHRQIHKTPEADKDDSETTITINEDGLKAKNNSKPETQESAGIFKSVKQVITRAGEKIASGVAKVGNIFRGPKIQEKTFRKSIYLPYGCRPKIYCRRINFKPTDFLLSSDLVIALTIKPRGQCHHEDTHLFMRFIQ